MRFGRYDFKLTKRYRLTRGPQEPPREEPGDDATRVATPVASLENLFKAADAQGYNAGLVGREATSNPYDRSRRFAGGINAPMSKGQRNAWAGGWRRGHAEFLRRRHREPRSD